MKDDPKEIAKNLLLGNRFALSKAITLVESKNVQDEQKAEEILKEILPYTGKSQRIGITGVPGVGKSTFIDYLGNQYLEKGKKVAVLAIDPSSEFSKGSILGDKTRMNRLAHAENAFIRPTASSGELGGVTESTYNTTLLCEAAGYEIIFIETVGVGQSEVIVKTIVDYLLLLMLPGAGDELQGIKKGIIEIANLVVINKSETEESKQSLLAKGFYENALHLQGKDHVPVKLCSSISGQGMPEIEEEINAFFKTHPTEVLLERKIKEKSIFLHSLEKKWKEKLFNSPYFQNHIEALFSALSANKKTKSELIKDFIDQIK